MRSERQEAIRRLAEDTRPLPDGEPFTVRFYRPEDGPELARLFYAVYGDGYPIDTYYIPDEITEAHQKGDLHSVVACVESGAVVSHEALYRSSPPNPRLYEIGLGLTLPAYRRTLAFARCSQLLLSLLGTNGIDAFYGEAVCNHVITQKLTHQTGATETALEPALMPARAYEAEQSAVGRVGCLMAFRVASDSPGPLCIPPCYRDQLTYMMEGLNLERDLIVADRQPTGGASRLATTRFPEAGVARCAITAPGDDLADQLGMLEHELRQAQYALLQCYIPLGASWAGPVVEQAQRAGFFLGGFLPVWFGDDGILLQKLFTDPAFETMKLHSRRAQRLKELVQRDWQRSQEG